MALASPAYAQRNNDDRGRYERGDRGGDRGDTTDNEAATAATTTAIAATMTANAVIRPTWSDDGERARDDAQREQSCAADRPHRHRPHQ